MPQTHSSTLSVSTSSPDQEEAQEAGAVRELRAGIRFMQYSRAGEAWGVLASLGGGGNVIAHHKGTPTRGRTSLTGGTFFLPANGLGLTI